MAKPSAFIVVIYVCNSYVYAPSSVRIDPGYALPIFSYTTVVDKNFNPTSYMHGFYSMMFLLLSAKGSRNHLDLGTK